jgi:hypothetical protein
VIAIVQSYAWWYDASFSAGRPRQLSFFNHASWQPPLGWPPWIAVALLGAAALLGFGAAAALARPPSVAGQRFRPRK